ncbi:CHASE domain-containing protein [Roseisalinus antarcticus]|uniref:histidine kinase n=1 Tax=Roseisalinus antarcticus TaxID=254357 RepID=A0A1Y5TVF5_9RHOB|nr:CHASE domain-containing protein [Roseisalinus antarcticus]SLN73693.1 Blue-light-activated protein [Roseisalinus antarcticus]
MRSKTGQWAFVLLSSVAVAVLVALVGFQQKRSLAKSEVEAAYGELELALATLSVRMATMAEAVEQTPDLTPLHFSDLYADLLHSSTRTHERAIAFIPEVRSAGDLDRLLDRFRAEYEATGYPEFALFPEMTADAIFPAIMVEPAARRADLFGFNVGASPERLTAAYDALEHGAMTSSAPVALSREEGAPATGFLLLYPVRLAASHPGVGYDQAILAAGMTPVALFSDRVALSDRNIVRLEIGIGGALLPVTLSAGTDEPLLNISIERDVTLPPIRTRGFEVPVQASVVYLPQLLDAAPPLIAASVTFLIGYLLMNLATTRTASKRELEAALRSKEVELREAYRIQARSQRVEALGRLVGGVAHDFNNILSVILGNLELMKEEKIVRTDEPLIEEAIGATQRGAHLTRQLLLVGRKSHLQPRTLDVARVLLDSTSMLRRVLPESIELTAAPAAGLWRIRADLDGLNNALLNLAINSRDAMEGRGKLIIEAANSHATPDYIKDRPEEELAPGRYVIISVTDTGGGMTAATAERAFDPFFTTKHATDGSGLGLPSVLGFCRQSGGTCRIYSEPGVGTTVRMFLPVSGEAANRATAMEPPDPPANAGGRILLAEDEDSVARIMQKQLESFGYAVQRVSTGDAAWELLQGRQNFDPLITDLVMPGEIQGAELARRVEGLLPSMKLLLVSGYLSPGSGDRGQWRRDAAHGADETRPPPRTPAGNRRGDERLSSACGLAGRTQRAVEAPPASPWGRSPTPGCASRHSPARPGPPP